MRLIGVGDVHGEHKKLRALLKNIEPQLEDQFVFLGDFVDRGSDTKGVIDYLLEFQHQFPSTVFLRGNHDWMMLDCLAESGIETGVQKLLDVSYGWRFEMGWRVNVDFGTTRVWLMNGADSTMKSYGIEFPKRLEDLRRVMECIPKEHLAFLANTKLWFEQANHIFMHAPGVNPKEPLEEQDPYNFIWERYIDPEYFELYKKTVVHGHNRVPEVLFSRTQISVDTGAGYIGGKLSACDVLTGETWSVS